MGWWQRESVRQTFATVGIVGGLFTPGEPLLVFLAAWSLYSVVYLAVTWFAIRRVGTVGLVTIAHQSLNLSRAERLIAYSPTKVAQGAAMTALVTVILVMPRADEQNTSEIYVLAVCLVAVVSSWLVLQVGFLMTYVGVHAEHGGMSFPGEGEPTLTDFAYFTIAVGTTFGTTDVEVTTSALRRQVLAHGVLAFVFNTLVLTVAISFTTGYLA